ncbi:putative bifunctional diguanylate cyclase/phosphodiesterase [Kineococcus sp. SYSU DK006]|uniref:putative bifunctional diguanylate cyclase/phosphodiesterase n=1 Tax=Kineococcus sp. SYSU DK006 TaxID=3383127 RepID=UPI003D7CF9B9
MSAPLSVTRPSAGRLAGGAGLLVLAVVLAALATAGTPALPLVSRALVVAGVTAVAACAAALVALRHGGNSPAYLVVGVVWGVGAVCAGLAGEARLGPFPLDHLALAAGEAGAVLVLLRLLVRARAGSDDPPLLVDALMLASALATALWDLSSRAGNAGPPGWAATTVLVLVVTSVLSCSAIALAVEQPRLRVPAVALVVHGCAVALCALVATELPVLAAPAALLALAAGTCGLVLLPRDGVVRHGGEAAERAARRLEVASLVPGPVLLVDIVALVVSPRADPVLFGLYLSVLVTFTVRHAATARSIDRTTARLRFQALHDSLTGLGNRTALERALTRPDRAQSLVLMELVGLDDVNDVLGVTVGDALIRAAAQEVTAVADGLGGSAYRTSGDEIAVLLPGDPAWCLRHAETLVAAVAAAPARVEGAGRFPLTATAGIAACPLEHDAGRGGGRGHGHGGGRDVLEPFVHADIALRDARHLGAGSTSVYSGTVAAEHARRSALRERLVHAVRDGDVDVHFQPVVSFTTGRVEKFEALARWEDPVLGRIPPVEFVAVAEESNLVVALGEHVLRTAVRCAYEAGVFSVGVALAVNVSVVQLQSPGFADIVRDVLEQHRIAPDLLTLELTESVFLDSDSPAERVVTELAALGCRIAIDDFGTGYSAFGYLGRLPVHVLKIDRSLTRSLTEDVNGQSVVTCVVDLATRLGLTVVVEGVETRAQADVCRFIGAPLGQGWLYSPAVPRALLGEQLSRTYPVPQRTASRHHPGD